MAQKLSLLYKLKQFLKMQELIKQYETAKTKALSFMKKGQLHAYFQALNEMNNYKKLMLTVAAN